MQTPNLNWNVPDCELASYQALILAIEKNIAVHTGTLAAGTLAVTVGTLATVADVTANTTLTFNRTVLGGTAGHLSYAIVPATSITFTSSEVTDSSGIAFQIH